MGADGFSRRNGSHETPLDRLFFLLFILLLCLFHAIAAINKATSNTVRIISVINCGVVSDSPVAKKFVRDSLTTPALSTILSKLSVDHSLVLIQLRSTFFVYFFSNKSVLIKVF